MISGISQNFASTALVRPSVNIAPAAPPAETDDSDEQARGAQAAGESARAQASGEVEQANGTQAEEETNEQGLTEDEQREVQELRERDREVRAHEQAHLAAAGQYARGGIQYTFERGPDNRNYAVGGQVSVDTSEVPGDPEATLQKAETLRRAALAPANPSSQDRSVAAEMTRMAAEARQEVAAEARNGGDDPDAAVSDELASGTEPISCPACGGRHSAEAHDGMTAYAGGSAPAQSNLAVT